MSEKKEKQSSNVVSTVNQIIASQGVLFVKLHQYHWFVQGPHFFTLHKQFEQLYNETLSYFDLLAERLIEKREKPLSTLSEFLEYSVIDEQPYKQKIPAEEMVNHLVQDFNTIKQLVMEGIELADDEDDVVTEDMLIGYLEQINKTLWMLRSFLGHDAN